MVTLLFGLLARPGRPRRDLLLQNLALRHQPAIAERVRMPNFRGFSRLPVTIA